jgi:hypothetical protein
MRDGYPQLLQRHPDAIALVIIATLTLSRVAPPHCLLRLFGF